MAKTLYGVNNEQFENKMNQLPDNIDEFSKLKGLEDFDPYEMTVGQMMFKLFEYGFGIPQELFGKKLVDLTVGDIALLDQLDEDFEEYRLVE